MSNDRGNLRRLRTTPFFAGLYGKISGGLTYWDEENVYSVDLRKNRKLKWLDSITGLSLILPELGVVQ